MSRTIRVVAHTLAGLAPSIGALEKADFRLMGGRGLDLQEPEAFPYTLARDEYLARICSEWPS